MAGPETTTLDVARARVFVRTAGRGPTALFLHGNPDSSDMWRGVIDRLRPRYRCVAPDLPGFGRSAPPVHRDWRLRTMGAFVDALVTDLGLDRPLHLVVHDVGGCYGLPWAIEHVQDVASVTVINCPFSSRYRWHFWARVWRTPLLGEACMRLMNRRLFCWVIERASPALPRSHARMAYALYKPSVRRVVLELYRALEPTGFEGWERRLPGLTRAVPTAVLWGDRDPYVAPEFASRFGTTQVHHFPEHGHWLPVEAPGTVADHLQEGFRRGESNRC